MNQSPRRPLLVRCVFGAACVATLLGLLYTLENWRGKRAWDQTRRELEAKGVSFDWSKYITAAVPDEQNIFKAPHMTEWFVKGDRANEATNELSRSLAGVGRCLASRGINAFQISADHRDTSWAADYLECSDLLAPQLEALQQALRRPQARPDGNYDRPWATPIPGFIAIRNVAQTLSQRARCYLLLGQPEPAFRELTLLYDMRRLLEGEPTTLVSAMIDVAITGLYVNTIADGLRLGAWREEQLIVLERQLGAIRLLEPLVAAIQDERVATCRLLEHSSRAELGKVLAPGPEKRGLWAQVTDSDYLFLRCQPRGWFHQNMASIARFDQWMVEMIDLTNHIVRPQSVDRTVEEVTMRLNRWLPYNSFARQAMPNFARAVQITVRNQTLANEALLACALERYRRAHKEYPASLADLVPGFLTEIPREIINGEVLKYRRTSSDHFVLYSIGWNEENDGGVAGKAVTEGDWVWE